MECDITSPAAAASRSPPLAKELTPEEIQKLKNENAQLRRILEELSKNATLARNGDQAPPFTPKPDDMFDSLKKALNMEQDGKRQCRVFKAKLIPKDRDGDTKQADIAAEPVKDKGSVVVSKTHKQWVEGAAADKEVCVVDLEDVEWWSMVEHPDRKKTDDDDDDQYVKCMLGDDDDDTDDSYVLVEDDDLVQAIGQFVSQSMKHYPEVRALSDNEMKQLLEGTFCQLREKSTFGKLYSWGQFLYCYYGWGTTVYQLYTEPAMVKLVLSSLQTIGGYVLLLLV